jgi:hypothetical protein
MANNAINTDVQKRRFALLLHAGYGERSPALRSGERGRGSGIRLSARRRANKRLEQTLRVVK